MRKDTIRWTISVSKDTDIAVRSFLAQRGMKMGDLPKFIEDAVKWRMLDQTIAEARGKFADMRPETRESRGSCCCNPHGECPEGRLRRGAGHRYRAV